MLFFSFDLVVWAGEPSLGRVHMVGGSLHCPAVDPVAAWLLLLRSGTGVDRKPNEPERLPPSRRRRVGGGQASLKEKRDFSASCWEHKAQTLILVCCGKCKNEEQLHRLQLKTLSADFTTNSHAYF